MEIITKISAVFLGLLVLRSFNQHKGFLKVGIEEKSTPLGRSKMRQTRQFWASFKFLTYYTLWGYIHKMKPEIKKKLASRLNRIEGQIRGLNRMIEDEKYCIDIITQSSAIKEALSSVEDLLLENHLSTHVIEQIKSGREKQAMGEIMKVYKRSKRK